MRYALLLSIVAFDGLRSCPNRLVQTLLLMNSSGVAAGMSTARAMPRAAAVVHVHHVAAAVQHRGGKVHFGVGAERCPPTAILHYGLLLSRDVLIRDVLHLL